MTFTAQEGLSLLATTDLERYTVAVTGGTLHVIGGKNPDGTQKQVSVAFQPSAISNTEVNTPITTVGAGTLTAAALIGGLITRSGPTGAYTDTTDTAANIQAAWAGSVGSSFEFTIKNTVAFPETLAGGSGVTLAGQTIVPPNSAGRFLALWTGTNTITITGIAVMALTSGPLEVVTGLTTNGAGTITAAGIVGAVTARSVPTVAFTDTSDTATNIIAALPNANVGQSFEYLYQNNSGVAATLAGGTGVTISGVTVVPANSWARFLCTYTAAATITMVGVAMGPNAQLPDAKLTSSSVTAGTIAAGVITGAKYVSWVSTNAVPGAQTVRTAAQMLADTPNAQVGMSYVLRITQTGAGTLTLTADGGTTVTLTGTMTVATNTWRDFICTFTGAATMTIQSIGTGTYS